MAPSVRIVGSIVAEMLAHARREETVECCGLLAGRDGRISAILPASNALASPTAYEIAPRQQFDLFRRMRLEELELMGIYHSHLATDNAPSPSDIEQAYYSEAVFFIIASRSDAARPVRAFSIKDAQVEELEVVAVEA